MINEDGSFDYSNMGHRPKIVVEAFAMKLMEAAGIDIPVLREKLLGLSDNGFNTDMALKSNHPRMRRGKMPRMICKRIMNMDSDEIVIEALDVGHGLSYAGAARSKDPDQTLIHLKVAAQTIPETVIQTIIGKPLTSVIRHEMLTDDTFTVTEVVNEEDGVHIRIAASWVEIE